MIKIHLHGALARLIDRGCIDISVSSPLEAVRFLCSVLPGFAKEYLAHPYFLRLDGSEEVLDEHTARVQFGKCNAMHILPDVAGAKAGGGGAGISPDSSAYENREDDSLSALFNGGLNTTEQGVCVPVIYGRVRRAGSAVISAGISIEEIEREVNEYADIDWGDLGNVGP